MNTEKLEKYRKHYVTEKRAEQYLLAGKCPVCMILLKSEYHTKCKYLDEMRETNEIVDKKNKTVL